MVLFSSLFISFLFYLQRDGLGLTSFTSFAGSGIPASQVRALFLLIAAYHGICVQVARAAF